MKAGKLLMLVMAMQQGSMEEHYINYYVRGSRKKKARLLIDNAINTLKGITNILSDEEI